MESIFNKEITINLNIIEYPDDDNDTCSDIRKQLWELSRKHQKGEITDDKLFETVNIMNVWKNIGEYVKKEIIGANKGGKIMLASHGNCVDGMVSLFQMRQKTKEFLGINHENLEITSQSVDLYKKIITNDDVINGNVRLIIFTDISPKNDLNILF